MVESNQTPNNADQSNSGENNGRPYGNMYWVYIIGAWSLIGLLLVAIFWPGMTERLKFFVGTLWVLVTAFAVIAQAVIYRKQWAIMESSLARSDTAIELTKQSISFNEKSFEYAQRAYITAKIRSVTDVTKRLDTFLMRLRIENSGNTPANDVIVVYGCGIREKPPWEKMPEGLLIGDNPSPYVTRLGVVAPNDSYHVVDTPRIGFESIEDFKAFEDGKLAFYCWGTIVYEDMFNEKRRTAFSFVQSATYPNGYPCEYGNEVY
jgi:hypothetical protein